MVDSSEDSDSDAEELRRVVDKSYKKLLVMESHFARANGLRATKDNVRIHVNQVVSHPTPFKPIVINQPPQTKNAYGSLLEFLFRFISRAAVIVKRRVTHLSHWVYDRVKNAKVNRFFNYK